MNEGERREGGGAARFYGEFEFREEGPHLSKEKSSRTKPTKGNKEKAKNTR